MPTPEQMKKEWWGGEYRHLTQIKDRLPNMGILLALLRKAINLPLIKTTI